MASICNGLALHGGTVPYCATFLVFHDYMRPAVRLAGLMGQQVIYLYTHDSIYLGEDGPTHQPIEHLMAMRLIPNLHVIRPADANETAAAWKMALARTDGPTALALSRQNLPTLDRTAVAPASGTAQGAYILAEAEGDHALTLIASGSEVSLALAARDVLQAAGTGTRVVSMPCWEAFSAQDAAYRSSVLGSAPRVSVEAGTTFGWERWIGDSGASVGVDRFGASAPGNVVGQQLGFTVDNVVAVARSVLH
jgi:transketolase